ncbi:bifunctional diguanylate cyclase/phosphodiesterase [Paenibacillus agricola]|uniref:EAL domain-containing protein n=1 Tax=Paenibacillus agricola TaxID=2716264 RepID=A0ABX0J0P9_9BACL|nr:bifunctional diguanylate cyclase/phosphodiesterase [Paenibacillus agricola]NHN29857.1 EAL domain-containing protein [Paenibacillus agricola]
MFVKLQESLLSLFEYNPDPCYLTDTNGIFVAFNDAVLELTGYSQEELLGKSFEPLIIPEQIGKVNYIFEQVVSTCLKVDFEIAIYRKDGERLELGITAMPINIEGQITGIIGIVKDLTKSKQLEQSLLKTQTQLKTIFDSIEVCLWSHDLTTGLIQISPACEAIYAYSQEAFLKDPDLWSKVIHPDDQLEVEKRQKELGCGKKVKHEYRILRADGSIRWVYDYTVPFLDRSGIIVRLDGVITDITERKKTEERLHRLAFHDALTGLPNRRLIRERIKLAIANAGRKKKKVIVMFLDLDGFKFINDSLGHSVGDRLLQRVAKRISRCLQTEDNIARMGGDEFVIVLEDLSKFDVEIIARQILETLAKPFKIINQEIIITTSIGISLYPDHANDHELLVKLADQAMYAAKEKGKNRFLFYNQQSDKFQRRLKLEQGLRKALQNQEFMLHYQPIVNVATGEIIGTEALIRWEHSSGIISPLEFIPIAEETGLISPIGDWVLRSACAQNKHWHDLGYTTLFVSVNLSVRQLEEEDLLKSIQRILMETGLDPRFLHIEITESTAMTNVNQAIPLLKALGEMGVSISIDDFGTGYSSLSYLEKFPIHTIKIDQTFIHSNQMAIIKAIVAMASSLNLNVIAEGVEIENQSRQIQETGCSVMQGHWFSKPVCSQRLESFLRNPEALAIH